MEKCGLGCVSEWSESRRCDLRCSMVWSECRCVMGVAGCGQSVEYVL